MSITKLIAAVALGLGTALAGTSHATVNAGFDVVDMGMVDHALGWICEDSDPTNTPSYAVSFVVYLNDTYYQEYGMFNWGTYRPDAAYRCGGYSYVGFDLTGFFAAYPGRKISLYYKTPLGNLVELPGSPKYCSPTAPGYCY